MNVPRFGLVFCLLLAAMRGSHAEQKPDRALFKDFADENVFGDHSSNDDDFSEAAEHWAHGRREQALRVLNAVIAAHPNRDATHMRAGNLLMGWGSWPQAETQYAWIVERSDQPPEYLEALLQFWAVTRYAKDSALDRFTRQWEIQIAAHTKDPKPYLLAAQYHTTENGLPIPGHLCASVMETFSPDALTESCPQASCVLNLAHVCVSALRFDEARELLRRTFTGSWGTEPKKAILREKMEVLRLLSEASGPASPTPPQCAFEKQEGIWRVICGAANLSYSKASGMALTRAGAPEPDFMRKNPQESVQLLQLLMEYMEAVRFRGSMLNQENGLPRDVREMLKGLGYLDQ